MSLRILFADDSVTAQNMGKKILTEAGYEVVAVSNGAAAVKKIAEQKPDIIILDVYMPGYSGLEVCEKVRSSIATIKTPVLLTVGKMEPYKPEDANRVRADGVIIKPFEASDLLAIVKKFEERIGPAPVAVAAEPAVVHSPAEEVAVQPAETNHEPPPRAMQTMVEVPDHMATSSAFSDLLGTDATRMEHFQVAPSREAAPPPESEPPAPAALTPEYDLPVSWKPEPEPQPAIVETASSAAATITDAPAHPIQIPVYQELESSQFEVVPTAAAPTGDIEITRESGLQESAEETTRNTIADAREPDLVTVAHHIPAPEQTITVDAAPQGAIQEVAVEAVQLPQQEAEIASGEADQAATDEASAPSLSEADFEARVAAAMAAYAQPAESEEAAPAIGETPVTQPHDSADTVEVPATEAVATVHVAAEQAIATATEPAAFASGPASIIEAEAPAEVAGKAAAQAAAAGVDHQAIVARVEAELPSASHAVAEAAAPDPTDHETIAQAVHRVMERMKENLVEEIVRELKTKR